MDTGRWRNWLDKRFEIADHTVQHFGDDGAFDAQLLLCCAVSAVAAYMWPGQQIDRRRFTELLVRFGRTTPHPTSVSVPTLVNAMEGKGARADAEALAKTFYPDSHARVLTHEDVDQDETAILGLLRAMPKAEIRRCSYASIIYEDLRSDLVHRFLLSDRLSDYPMSMRRDIPSYFNLLLIPGERSRRVLHLPYPYVREVVRVTCSGAFDHWDKRQQWEEPRPPQWWIDGG